MANEIKWSSPVSAVTLVNGATVNTGAGNLSAAVDNDTDLKRYATFEWQTTHASSPTANTVWKLYFLIALDGTNYEDGSTSVEPVKSPEWTFPVKANTSAQKITSPPIPLPPHKFKVLLWNGTNQNSGSSATTLKSRTFGEEVQ